MSSSSSNIQQTSQTSSDAPGGELVVLPEDADLKYLAEGAANVVYKVVLKNRVRGCGIATTRDHFKGNLLRLRKDLPTIATILTTQKAYENRVAPLFPKHMLLDQRIISLPPGIVESLNRALHSTARPESRIDTLLAAEKHGLLVKDMSSPPGYQLVEFKPKWLIQSPTAPPDATRCRTCALRARRKAFHHKTPESQVKSGYCPLDLVSSNQEDVEKAAWSILYPKHNYLDLSDKHDIQAVSQVTKFTNFLRTTPILPLLKKHQDDLDRPKRGSVPLFTDSLEDNDLQNLLLAYTLRDCSVFVLIPEGEGEIIANIGDLDLKSKLKLEKWMKMERELYEEGWYAGGNTEECFLGR